MVAPITPISKTPPPGTGSISLAPGWAETTVRWLRSRHPEYITRSRSGDTFVSQLTRALIKASYLYEEGMSVKSYSAKVNEVATDWRESDHDKLVAWLSAGGYSGGAKVLFSARKAGKSTMAKKVAELAKAIAAGEEESRDVMIVRGPDGEVLERITMEPDDGSDDDTTTGEPTPDSVEPEIIDEVERKLTPKSEMSQRRELQEIVEQELLKTDERYGIW